MGEATIDVRKTRTFGIEGYLVRQVPIAIVVMLFGAGMIALARSSETRQTEGIVLGAVLIAAAIGFIAYAYGRRLNPKPFLELSASGVLYHIAQGKDFRIPWREIQGFDVIDIRTRRGFKFRDVTVALVSREFYDANIPFTSWWARGPTWRYYFVPLDHRVQVAFHHDVLSVPADELWRELETRWRLLSGHPNAPQAPLPRIVARRLLKLPPAVKRVALAVLAVAAVPAAYFWQWPAARMTFPDFPDDPDSYYLHQLLDRSGVQARLAGGEMVTLHRIEVRGIGPTHCEREIRRDPSRDGLTPAYLAEAFCTADLSSASGATAKAVFKLVTQTSTSEDWEGKPVEYKAIVPATLDAAEAAARLAVKGGGS